MDNPAIALRHLNPDCARAHGAASHRQTRVRATIPLGLKMPRRQESHLRGLARHDNRVSTRQALSGGLDPRSLRQRHSGLPMDIGEYAALTAAQQSTLRPLSGRAQAGCRRASHRTRGVCA